MPSLQDLENYDVQFYVNKWQSFTTPSFVPFQPTIKSSTVCTQYNTVPLSCSIKNKKINLNIDIRITKYLKHRFELNWNSRLL